uniref:DUF4939 domain-containing protein n=1 Tax=Anolis carolinensis TaxID=28377 RepID=H9GI52_ANOCA
MAGLDDRLAALKLELVALKRAQQIKGQVIVPERFDGTREKLPTFLAQVDLYFLQISDLSFPTDTNKVAFILSLLTGPAGRWAVNVIRGNSPIKNNLVDFKAGLNETFGDPLQKENAGWALYRLKQAKGSLIDYLNKFNLFKHQLDWGEHAFMLVFTLG